MGEPFDAIGFEIRDEPAYQALAEEARQHGVISRVQREVAMLHGCCWRLGEGLEVWTVLHESKQGMFYADCRPAFRSRQQFMLYPWEIIEYEEDGEALVHATIAGAETDVIFELQNITEINPTDYRERAITATIAGLSYRAQLSRQLGEALFEPLEKRYPHRRAAENDYFVRGVLSNWRTFRNPRTSSELFWLEVEVGKLTLEMLVNRADLKGELRRGAQISTEVWLQGHILTDWELQARYEGVDYSAGGYDFWRLLRREN